MTKEEFNPLVNELLSKVDRLRFDDYYGALSVIREFERFVERHHKYLDKNVLGEIDRIKDDFADANRYNRMSEKEKHWSYAINGLKDDIESMKDENNFPVNDN